MGLRSLLRVSPPDDASHARTAASLANADAALAEARVVNGLARRLIEDAERADEALRAARVKQAPR